MSQPKVSIIVPVYNAEKYLERCVRSLTEQTLADIEIILIDDSATDSSPQMCDHFAKGDPRIKVIHKENEGAGLARNAGLSIATGEYIGFVDSDDFVDRNMFKTLCEKADQYHSDLILSGVVLVDGNIFQADGERVLKEYFNEDTHFVSNEDLKKLRMGIAGSLPHESEDSQYGMSIWKNLFRHDIIKRNHLVFQSEREIFSEDALFMIDYIACITKATGIKEAFYHYCRNEDSISKSYHPDRFEKVLIFIGEVEKRLQSSISPTEYKIYIDRFWQAMCRVSCSQEIMHAADLHIKYSELRSKLKAICTHPMTQTALKTYPIGKLPFRQFIFAFGLKHKLYFLLKVLVELRK